MAEFMAHILRHTHAHTFVYINGDAAFSFIMSAAKAHAHPMEHEAHVEGVLEHPLPRLRHGDGLVLEGCGDSHCYPKFQALVGLLGGG